MNKGNVFIGVNTRSALKKTKIMQTNWRKRDFIYFRPLLKYECISGIRINTVLHFSVNIYPDLAENGHDRNISLLIIL